MRRLLLLATLALAAQTAMAAELTEVERRWLNAGWPVIAYAKTRQLPLDIVVQPKSKVGDAPLAMGYDHGRCLLVLSMRGNPDAETTLAKIEPELLPAIVEAMFAHELGHCWRYVQGVWHVLPAGFQDVADAGADPTRVEDRRFIRNMRREEGYADLVGLAWTSSHRSEQYARVQAWLEAYRAAETVDGTPHDTLVWVRLAREPREFTAAQTLFEQADIVWRRGLLGND